MARTDVDQQLDDPTLEQPPGGPVGWLTSCLADESTPRDLENMRRWLGWMVADVDLDAGV